MRIVDILKVDGTNTFLWFEEFARKEENPRGVSKSTLRNTGFSVWPLETSTLKSFPSVISPDVKLK